MWCIVRGRVPDDQIPLLADVSGVMRGPNAVRVREGNTRLTALLPAADAVWKWYTRVGSRATVRALYHRSAVCKEFDMTAAAIERGIRTPRPLFAAERRTLGILRGQLLAFERIEPATDLEALLDPHRHPDHLPAEDVALDLLRDAAQLIAQTHEEGLLHGDVSLGNFLLQGEPDSGRLWLTDMAKMEFTEEGDGRTCEDDLAQGVNNIAISGPGVRFAAAFLREYARARDWPDETFHETAGRLLGRVRGQRLRLAQRTAGHALREGRRNQGRRHRGLHLLAPREVDLERLAAAFPDWPGGQHGAEPLDLEIVAGAEADDLWAISRVAERFDLPCRRCSGILSARGRRPSSLALEKTDGPPLAEALGATENRDGLLHELAALVRRLHAYGIRFQSFSGDTIHRGEPCPAAAQEADQLYVYDLSALRLTPETPEEDSWRTVAGYCEDAFGPEAARVFLPLPLRP
jgi:hypothetical protein